MFNILGEYKLVKKEKPVKVRLDLNYPLFSDDNLKVDAQYLRLLKDIARVGLLELEEIPVEQKKIRTVKINNNKVFVTEKIVNIKSLYRVTINRKDQSEWIRNRHKYISKTYPYSKEILNIIKKDFNFNLTEDCEFLLTEMIKNNVFNITPKQLYLKNKSRNKKLKYDINGNRIR